MTEARAAELLRCAIEGREPEAVARWLGDALSALLCRDADGLGKALGLPGSALRDAGRVARNAWLIEAAALAAPGAAPWPAAGDLLAAERATRIARVRARRHGMPPGDSVAAALAMAEAFGVLPTTQEQLHTILGGTETRPRAISVVGGETGTAPHRMKETT
ncbi:MAG: hypothetical protein ACK59R_12055 [Pseudomonadota bacterium]